MSYSAYDPRSEIISTIGTSGWDKDYGEYTYIEVTDNNGATVYIPLFLEEEIKTESLPVMPFCGFRTVVMDYQTQDIGAAHRKVEGLIDIHIYFTDTDNIVASDFHKNIRDTLHNLIRTNQMACSFPTINFVNIQSEKVLDETDGRQVVWHYICSVYVLYYDLS